MCPKILIDKISMNYFHVGLQNPALTCLQSKLGISSTKSIENEQAPKIEKTYI